MVGVGAAPVQWLTSLSPGPECALCHAGCETFDYLPCLQPILLTANNFRRKAHILEAVHEEPSPLASLVAPLPPQPAGKLLTQ